MNYKAKLKKNIREPKLAIIFKVSFQYESKYYFISLQDPGQYDEDIIFPLTTSVVQVRLTFTHS